MFKKLRNRFLILNIILISILLISSFSVVFAVIYNDTVNESNKILENSVRNLIIEDARINHDKSQDGFSPKNFLDARQRPDPMMDTTPRRDMSPERSTLLTITIKQDGSLDIRSPYEYSEDFYNTLIDAALKCFKEDENQVSSIKTLRYDNVPWKFRVEKNFSSYYIGAVNIETEYGILQKLILTLLCVLIFTLLIIFLICLYFANKSIRPIKEAWNKQNRFIADASHELKTPLTTINTNIDVLLSGGDTTKEQTKWLTYIKDETTRMTKLTHDLLTLAGLEHNDNKLSQKIVCPLSQVVQTSILTMEAVMYENEIKLTDNIKSDINVIGDSTQIKQLIMILLDNAAKYTPKNGSVTVKLTDDDKHAYLSVKNTGGGISPDESEKIFDRFYRSDKSRTRSESGGYGLGLSIAKSIVTSYNGTIKLKKNTNDCTEFLVTLKNLD